MEHKDNYDRILPMPVKLGFGIANLGDTVITEFVGAFFIFFLTNIAGVRPALAGTIVFLGVMWDAVSDPIIGTMSDRCTLDAGRRRPFLLISTVPLILLTTMMFTKVNFSANLKFVYFVVVSVFYWTAYTLFNIPYLSLGSELTTNNDEKTRASSIRQVFGTCGLFFANALPMILVSLFKGRGISEERAWTFAALTLGAIAGTAIFITWRATRGWEIKYPPQSKDEPIFRSLGKVLTYKPYILVIAASFLFYFAFNTCNASVIYNTIVVVGATEADTAVVYLAGTIVGVILSVLIGKLAVVFDKKWVFIAFMAIAGFALVIFKFVGFHSITDQVIQFCMAHFAIIGFLVLSYNLLYDVCEVYEFKTGEMLTGVMISYFSFFIKLGKATALQAVGILLDLGGYDASLTIQPDSAKAAVTNMASIIPGCLMLLCALVVCFYPINRSRFRAMQNARKLKDEGKAYSTSEFDRIL